MKISKMKIYINNYKSSIGTGTNNIKGKSRNHYTHNTSGSSLSSNHFYKMSINSKNSSEQPIVFLAASLFCNVSSSNSFIFLSLKAAFS